jgi:glycosyltransferase involved in cell wall biosynthesis
MGLSGLRGVPALAACDALIASSPPFFPHVSGAFLSWFHRVPLILEVRDLWPDYLAGMGLLRGRPANALFALERALLRRATRVVVVTESFGRRIETKGVSPDRIVVIPNGVDSERYAPGIVERPPLDSLRRNDGEFLVGYLGNFGAGQGLEVVLDAAVRLQAEGHRDVRFVLAGDGPTKRDIAARGGPLSPLVTVHDPIPKDATRDFYNACDACLVPLAPIPVFQETVPSKIFEIMACGRPVIASLDGEGRRIVQDSGGGTVVPPGDGDALAKAIIEMRRLPEDERSAMGTAGRDYVRSHYERRVLADRYLALIEATVEERCRERGELR